MTVADHGDPLRRGQIEIASPGCVIKPAALATGDHRVAAPLGGAAQNLLLDGGVIEFHCLLHGCSFRCSEILFATD